MRSNDVLVIPLSLCSDCGSPAEPDVRPPLEVRAEVQQDGARWFLVVGATGWVDHSDSDQFGGLWGDPAVSHPAGASIGLELFEPIWTGGLSCLEVELGPIPEDTPAVWLTGMWTNRLPWWASSQPAAPPRAAERSARSVHIALPVYHDGNVSQIQCRSPTWTPGFMIGSPRPSMRSEASMSGQEYAPAPALSPKTSDSDAVADASFAGDEGQIFGGNAYMNEVLNGLGAGGQADDCTYVVKPHDTLWDIAQREYGDPREWQDLYRDNREVVGRDPNLIRPGQPLNVCRGDPAPGPEADEILRDPEAEVLVCDPEGEELMCVPEGEAMQSDPEEVAETCELLDEDLEELDQCLPDEEVVEVIDEAASCGPQTAEEVKEAVAERLDDSGLFNVVTDEEATEALDMLLCLPPDQQAVALSNLDDDAFENLIDEVPEERRIEFQSLFDSATDPKRKLLLWGELHKARSRQLEDSTLQEAPDDATDEEEDRIDHRNDVAEDTQDETEDEVDDEVEVLLERMENGETITVDDINQLDARKRQEMDIESRYGVNLTNERDEDIRRVWSAFELEQIDHALSRSGPEQTGDNPGLEEIFRTASPDSPSVLADCGDGKITIYDRGAAHDPATGTNDPTLPTVRVADEDSPLAGHDPAGPGTGRVGRLEAIFTHEQGHAIHQGDEALWEEWLEVSDWKEMDDDDVEDALEDAGMSEDDAEDAVEELDDDRDEHYGSRSPIVRDGRRYEVDPYESDFWSVDDAAIPSGADWDYARSNPEDHFAEVHMMAVPEPEQLHSDLVQGPSDALEDANQDLVDLRGDASATPEQIAAAELRVQRAEHAAEVRRKQWDFFRQRVFHTDDSDIQAMTAAPGQEDVVEAYQAEAAKCQTPQQLAAVRARYEDLLDGTP